MQVVNENNIMKHIPPIDEEKVTVKNWMGRPYSTWAFVHPDYVLKTDTVPRSKDIQPLNVKLNPSISGQSVEIDGKTFSFDQVLKDLHVDAIILSKNDKVIYEDYISPYINQDRTHIWFSMTKSLTSLLIGNLVEKGLLDLSKSPSDYIPQLKGSGYERTTIQQVLDMTAAMEVESDAILSKVTPKDGPIAAFFKVGLNDLVLHYYPSLGVVPFLSSDKGAYEAISHFKASKKLKPGEKLEYLTPNADVLGWLVATIHQKPYQEVVYDEIWSKIGAEQSAFMWVDQAGQGISSAGMNSSLRDLLRVGLLVANHGKLNGKSIISEDWIQTILTVPEANKKLLNEMKGKMEGLDEAYHNQWWIMNSQDGEFMARGMYNQALYINLKEHFVAAVYSSHTVATTANEQYEHLLWLFRKLAKEN